LSLERDVSRAARGFASYILPKVNIGGKQIGKGFNTNQTGSHRPDFTTPRGGSTAGNPKQGSRETKYGDEAAGTTRSASLVPMDAPPRDNAPDGTTSASSGIVFGSNTLSRNLNNKIKGKMDFNNSSVLGGSFGILGQKKPTSAPRDPHAHQSIDSFIIPYGGDAVMASNGFALAGKAEGMSQAYGAMKVHLRVPANAGSNTIKIFGRTTLQSALAKTGVLFITCKCVETGDIVERTVQIQSTVDDAEQETIFFNGNVRGAEVAGNTIEVLFERQAGDSLDTATSSSLSVHNIQIANDTRSVSGKAKSDSFSYGL